MICWWCVFSVSIVLFFCVLHFGRSLVHDRPWLLYFRVFFRSRTPVATLNDGENRLNVSAQIWEGVGRDASRASHILHQLSVPRGDNWADKTRPTIRCSALVFVSHRKSSAVCYARRPREGFRIWHHSWMDSTFQWSRQKRRGVLRPSPHCAFWFIHIYRFIPLSLLSTERTCESNHCE